MTESDTIYDINKPREECGVVAVYAPGLPVAAVALELMHGLQHRGETAAGVSVHHDGLKEPIGHKGTGLIPTAVRELHTLDTEGRTSLDRMTGSPVAGGHVRYGTSESNSIDAAQPFHGEHAKIAVSHNGHVENVGEVAALFGTDVSQGISDSHKITLLLDARAAKRGLDAALREILPCFDGAYCLTIVDGDRIIAARDPWGFHPLAVGALEGDAGYVVASEAVAFERVKAKFLFDVNPGEIVMIDSDGMRSTRIDREVEPRRCLYEFAYTSRNDGEIDGVPVSDVRELLGRFLAEDSPVDADIVVGMPETGMTAATGYAIASGLPHILGAIKNPYSSRSFIQRGAERARTLSDKARIIPRLVKGHRVVVVDDSMIKGNTMAANVQKFRDAEAAEVHVRIAAPPYKYSCYMGMDTGNTDELIARDASLEEIRQIIGADSVAYITPERAQEAVDVAASRQQKQLGRLCTACSTGEYPFAVPGSESSLRRGRLVSLGMPAMRGAIS